MISGGIEVFPFGIDKVWQMGFENVWEPWRKVKNIARALLP